MLILVQFLYLLRLVNGFCCARNARENGCFCGYYKLIIIYYYHDL